VKYFRLHIILQIRHKVLKILLFLENNSKKQKALQHLSQRAGICKLPLLETFGTFCWGEFMEKLRNTYKLKELIDLPVSVPNNV